ncbi:hypothetical protein DFJ73DRAFT_782824 [Zopfochytrium polystomum]|nr:hypothetical protein DFJ73DRAFT_782824 [Zopfochytrium polystomum]
MKRITRLTLLLVLALTLQQLSAKLPWLQEADGPVAVMAAPSPSPGLCGSKPCDGRPANKNEERYVYRAMSKADKARFDKKEPIVASSVSKDRETRNVCADCPNGGPPDCMACHIGNFHSAPSNWISTTAQPNTAKNFNEDEGKRRFEGKSSAKEHRENEDVLIKGSIPHKACKLLPGTTVNRFRPHSGRVYRRSTSRKDGC